MICPACDTHLEHLDVDQITIDECPACYGRWFDRDELRKVKDSHDQDLIWLDFDPFGKDMKEYEMPWKGKQCPKCHKHMLPLEYHDSKTQIDKCEACEGVWLDHGEFEKIVSYLHEKLVSMSTTDYVKETFRQFAQLFIWKENPISEMKDFLSILYFLKLRLQVENPNIAKLSQFVYENTPFK